MWITGGDHELTENIVHLVLAKAPGGGPGVKGISLFIVPKFLPDGTRNDVALVSLNHKMGNHATTNALLNFGDGTHQPSTEPGAVGYLVGEEAQGPDLHVPHDERSPNGGGIAGDGERIRRLPDIARLRQGAHTRAVRSTPRTPRARQWR